MHLNVLFKRRECLCYYLLHSIVGSKAQHARLNVLVLSDTVVLCWWGSETRKSGIIS